MIKRLFILIFLSLITLTSHSFAYDDEDEFSAFDNILSRSKVQINDPFEPVNRQIFKFNDLADRYVVGYVVDSYRFVTNKPVRRGVTNFFENLSSPFTILNSLLQGKFDNALSSFSSFLVNSTVGILGVYDVASSEHIRFNKEDFGQTLAYYGAPSGPYLVLPFLGPSTGRDFAGSVITRSSSPFSFDVFNVRDRLSINIDNEDVVALNIANLINTRESISIAMDDLRSSSIDFYAATRSYYLQNRQSKINQ